jgi:hypothetical protein
MSAFIPITGTLFRNPKRRTSKAGKPDVTAILRVKDGEEPMVEHCRLCGRRTDDAFRGTRLYIYPRRIARRDISKAGEKRVSLGVIADHVTALRQPKHQKAAALQRATIPGYCTIVR